MKLPKPIVSIDNISKTGEIKNTDASSAQDETEPVNNSGDTHKTTKFSEDINTLDSFLTVLEKNKPTEENTIDIIEEQV